MGQFAIDLLRYYDGNRRLLPWRGKDVTPYQIWVSEIMLQQTRIEAVKPYYTSFMDRFPDVLSLARANEEEVLKSWEGLGYYSRARCLHKAAMEIVTDHEGRLPEEKEELAKLPGIGDYTSSAIAALAFNKPCVAIDGNLLRLYARINAFDGDVKTQTTKKEAEAFFQARMDKSRAGDYLSALMDVGELICLPSGSPQCAICPFSKICKAHKQGKETAYPRIGKKSKKEVPLFVFLLRFRDGIVLHKRQGQRLMDGLYELPNIEEKEGQNPAKALETLGFASFFDLRFQKKENHVFTHLVYRMDVYEAEIDHCPEGYVSASMEKIEKDWPMPTCFRKLID